MFGLVIPGLPVVDIPQISELEYGEMIPNPSQIPMFCLFMRMPIPDNLAAAVYYSLDGANWEYLDALYNTRPSQFMRTGWPFKLNPSVNSVALKVNILPQETVQALCSTCKPEVPRLEYGRKVALNLFYYLTSRIPSCSGLDIALQDWLKKFESKSRVDPDYVLNTE